MTQEEFDRQISKIYLDHWQALRLAGTHPNAPSSEKDWAELPVEERVYWIQEFYIELMYQCDAVQLEAMK